MEGYIQAHQDELTNPLSLEALLAREDHLRPQDIQEMKASPMAQHWITAYSLVYDKEIHVPINFVSYIHGSNGMAAGNTLEEALIQACCEIFERYSQIEIIKSETVVPTLSEETIDSPLIQEMMDFYRANNVRVMLKDLSLNEHLPSVGVLFLNDNLPADRLEHRMLIPGASFYGTEGLTRCFTEGVQGRQNLDSPRPQLDRSVVPKEQVANYYLLMRCGVAPTDISFLEKGEHKTYRPWQAQDIMEEIEAIKSICRQFNTDCILVNHTHPVIDMPVVRVVIPKISDFLPFLGKDILVSQKTRPSAAWQGEVFQRVMKSFFPKGNN
jgi:YcaO-like protein with predicted kinase domain